MNGEVRRFELLSWYWHFVDAVWVAVFTVVYELEDSDRPACVAEFVAIYR